MAVSNDVTQEISMPMSLIRFSGFILDCLDQMNRPLVRPIQIGNSRGSPKIIKFPEFICNYCISLKYKCHCQNIVQVAGTFCTKWAAAHTLEPASSTAYCRPCLIWLPLPWGCWHSSKGGSVFSEPSWSWHPATFSPMDTLRKSSKVIHVQFRSSTCWSL